MRPILDSKANWFLIILHEEMTFPMQVNSRQNTYSVYFETKSSTITIIEDKFKFPEGLTDMQTFVRIEFVRVWDKLGL